MKPVTVTKRDKAFKGAVRSFEGRITNERDPLMQLNGSNKEIESRLKELQVEMKMYKQYTTMKIRFLQVHAQSDKITSHKTLLHAHLVFYNRSDS